jgi:APA family basic amino acid/polyamine antiporter
LAAFLGVVFVSIRSFAQLTDQFVIGIWPFYALAVAATFVLRRKRAEIPRPYRTWGYPFVPLVFLLTALYLLGNYMITEPFLFFVDVAVILTGIPIYVWWARHRGKGGTAAVVSGR